jgi:replicative DNA helicase
MLANLGKSVVDNTILTPKEIADLGLEYYANLNKGLSPSALTGFKELDYETGGAFAGELWIFGGRPGIGKTSVLLQMAQSMSKQGNVLFASLEMNWRQLLDRMIASDLGIHPRSLRVGQYSEEFYDNILKALPKITEQNLYFFGRGILSDQAGITTNILYHVASAMQNKIGLRAICVDYLGLFADEAKNLYEKTTHISARLKRMAESLEVPIICASQLSRSLEHEKGDKKPSLHSLRDSGAVEQDADVVLFLYREDYYRDKLSEHPEAEGSAEIIIAKQRQGASNIEIPLTWDYDRRIYV